MHRKYDDFRQSVNEEVGFRNLKKIAAKWKTSEIWFHQDLDGVFSGICMKEFLNRYYDIKTVDCHIIQYGNLEYVVDKCKPGNLPVIVDFAHSKVGYLLFDHHDKQSGEEESAGIYAKKARSNAETISGEIAYSDIFINTDIELCKTVDSADFLKYNVTPDDIENAVFKFDKKLSGERNRFLMGFVVNRLLLVYKNKRITVMSLDGKRNHVNKNLLECLLMDSSPSLYSIFSNLRHYMDSATSLDWSASGRTYHKPGKLATTEEIKNNLEKYISTRKEYDEKTGIKTPDLNYDENYKIVYQYGIGRVFDTGSYDRYVVFKNFPEADFVCTVFPMGLIQVSCNPFREKKLEKINLGEIAKEVLETYKYQLSNINISISKIKSIAESDAEKIVKKYGPDYAPIGFKFSDLLSFYKNSIIYLPNRESGDMKTREVLDLKKKSTIVDSIKKCMDKPFSEWTSEEQIEMDWFKIPAWDIIIGSSGGHPSITNIQGLNYLGSRPDLLKRLFGVPSYVPVMKKIADTFMTNLKSKIDIAKEEKEIEYAKTDFKLLGSIHNENFNYFIDANGKEKSVSKEEFIEAGFDSKFKPKVDNDGKGFKIDIQKEKIIGKFD